MQRIKHIVHYRLPKQLQWEREFPSKSEALQFIAEVEENGGIAIYIEDVVDDNIEIGSSGIDKEYDNG